MKLFAIYVGGASVNSNIELHDMRFVIADHIEDTYAELHVQWWGLPDSLHIDCWSAVTQADGYSVTLRAEPSDSSKKLYFINLGGYDPADFSESHKNMFVVAETESKAKVKAIKTVLHWKAFHRDYIYEVEKAFCLSEMAAEKALHIHLEPIESQEPAPFICKYIPINKKR